MITENELCGSLYKRALSSETNGKDFPFTDFGRVGKDQIDFRVFDQNVYWVNIRGEEFILEDMSISYLTNVQKFILRLAPQYHHNILSYMFNQHIAELEENDEEYVKTDVYKEVFKESDFAQLSPENWMKSTVLYQKIETLLA